MTGLRTVIAKLKKWLHKKQPESITVRTYAGVFKFPEEQSLKEIGFDELVQYAEATPNLRRVALDQMKLPGADPIVHEAVPGTPETSAFHQQINTLSLGWARHVVALHNQIK